MSSIQGLSDWEAHSTLPPPPSAPEHEQEAAEPAEARPAAPEQQGSWWRRRSVAPAPGSGSARSSGETKREGAGVERGASPANAEGGKLGSILGRFRRGASEQEGEDELPPEWQPKNLDEVKPPLTTTKQKQHEEYVVEDELDDFFAGSAPSRPRGQQQKVAQPQARPYDDGFSGLMGTFSAAPAPRKVPVPVKPKVRTAKLDPFDPFADEDDQLASPALAPVAAPLRSASGSSVPRMISPPLQPVSRPITPLAPPPPPPPAPAPILGPPPQPANLTKPPPPIISPVAPPASGPAAPADAFDDFFKSVTKPPPPRSAAVAALDGVPARAPGAAPAPALSAPLVPRPFITPPISPPRRSPLAPATATTSSGPQRRAPLGAVRAPELMAQTAPAIAPPPPSRSPVGFVPPPPPPSQPLGKGFGFLPPPPPPGGVVRSGTPPVAAVAGGVQGGAVPAVAKPAPKKSGGPLDLEDLSFFES